MGEMSRRSLLAGATSGVALWSFAPIGAAQGREMLFGIPVETNNSLPLYMAEAGGFLAQEGIKGSMSTGSSGTNVRQMLAAGQMLYAQADPIHPLAMTGANRATRILMACDSRASVALMIRQDLWDKGIRTVEAFASHKPADGGQPKLGVTRVGAQTWLYGTELMKKHGKLDAVNYVSLGQVSNILGAFKTGKIEACMATALMYFSILDEKLGQAAFNATDEKLWRQYFGHNFPGQVMVALADQVKADPKLTQSVINAVYRALRAIERTPAAEIAKLVQPRFLANMKLDVVQREIEFLKPIYSRTGDIAKAEYDAGLKVWCTDSTKVAPQPYEAMLDLSFLRQAQAKFG